MIVSTRKLILNKLVNIPVIYIPAASIKNYITNFSSILGVYVNLIDNFMVLNYLIVL